MTFDPNQADHPYVSPSSDPWQRQGSHGFGPKQSGLGIASLLVAIAAGVTAFALVVVAGVMEVSTPGGMDEESPQAILVGLGILGVLGLNFLGLGLGVAGIVQPDRSRVVAILGLVFNALVILGLCGLMALGMTMAAQCPGGWEDVGIALWPRLGGDGPRLPGLMGAVLHGQSKAHDVSPPTPTTMVSV